MNVRVPAIDRSQRLALRRPIGGGLLLLSRLVGDPEPDDAAVFLVARRVVVKVDESAEDFRAIRAGMQLGRMTRPPFKPPRLLDQRQEAPDRVTVLGRLGAGRHVELERRRRRACERRRRVVRIAAKERLARPADRISAGLPQVIRLGKVERRRHSRLARSKLFRRHVDLRQAADVGNRPALLADDYENLVMGGGGRLIIPWLFSDVFKLELHRDGIARSKALLFGGDPRAKPVVGIAPFGCGWRLSLIAALRRLLLFYGTRNGEAEHDQHES